MARRTDSAVSRRPEEPLVTVESRESVGSGRLHDTPNNQWISTALAYVPHVARRYLGYGVPFEELLAAGNLGLVEAALRFQPARKVKFVTYADWWIRKSIFKVLEDQSGPVRLPRYRQEQLRAMRESRRAWRKRNGHEPDREQLANEAGMSPQDIDRLRTLSQAAISLEDPVLPGGERSLAEMLSDDDEAGPQEAAVRSDLMGHIRDLIGALEPKERTVIVLRYGFAGRDPMTLRAIGREMGISRERVRQLERRALTHLRTLV